MGSRARGLVIAVMMKPWEGAEVERAISRAILATDMWRAVGRMQGKKTRS